MSKNGVGIALIVQPGKSLTMQKQRAPLQKMERGYPLQMIAADIVGPLPKSKLGNKYILVVSDYFKKWEEAYGIPN